MIRINDKQVELNYFPDGTFLIKEKPPKEPVTITWLFEKNQETLALYFLVKHLRSKGIKKIDLKMPYIPNARQDRVKTEEDVFTLKYFAEIINSLKFNKVTVLDPHSYVSEALFEHIDIQTPKKYVEKVIQRIGREKLMLFFPDEGAMKRYSNMFELPYTFGIKKRDWATGQIAGLEVTGQTEKLAESVVLIVDDICSKGGTFYYSAKALKELGAKEVYLYISHCENSIFEGEILKTDLINKVYTTNSIFTGVHKRVEVFDYE